METKKAKAGYSLFELIILMVVLAVVCYFIFLNQESFLVESPEETEMISVEMVRIAIHNYAVESKKLDRRPVYPAVLDSANDGDMASPKTPLFTSLFPTGLTTAWKKVRTNEYVYMPSANNTVTPNNTYHYDPLRGTFEKGKPKEPARVA